MIQDIANEASIEMDDRWDREGERELSQSSLVFKANFRAHDSTR